MFGLISLAAVLAASNVEAPAAKTYAISATIQQNGAVVATPSLLAKAGEAAAFVSIKEGKGFAVKIVATPDSTTPAGADGVKLAVDVVVTPGPNASRHALSTVVVKPGEPLNIDLGGDSHTALSIKVGA